MDVFLVTVIRNPTPKQKNDDGQVPKIVVPATAVIAKDAQQASNEGHGPRLHRGRRRHRSPRSSHHPFRPMSAAATLTAQTAAAQWKTVTPSWLKR